MAVGSIYQAILENANRKDEQMMEAVNAIAPELFIPLINDGELLSPGDLKPVMLYIAYAYSKESKCLLLGGDINDQKRAIADAVALRDQLHGPVVLLKNKSVRDVIVAYLELQAHRDFRHLMRKRDLYESLSDMQLSDVMGKDGRVDMKVAFESSKHLDALLEDIQKLEEKLRGEYKFHEINIGEVKKVANEEEVSSLHIEKVKLTTK